MDILFSCIFALAAEGYTIHHHHRNEKRTEPFSYKAQTLIVRRGTK